MAASAHEPHMRVVDDDSESLQQAAALSVLRRERARLLYHCWRAETRLMRRMTDELARAGHVEGARYPAPSPYASALLRELGGLRTQLRLLECRIARHPDTYDFLRLRVFLDDECMFSAFDSVAPPPM